MSYEITTPDGDSISMHGGENKTLRFQVTNKASRDMDTECKIICEDALDPGWCRLTPDGDQLVTAGQTKIYEVAIGVPDSVQTSSGKVTVEASWVRDPNGTFTTGPKVGLVLLPGEPKPKFWEKNRKWLLIVLGLLLVLAVVVMIFMGGRIKSFSVKASAPSSSVGVRRAWSSLSLEWTVMGDPSRLEVHLGGRKLPLENTGSKKIQFRVMQYMSVMLQAHFDDGGTESKTLYIDEKGEGQLTSPN